MRIALFGVWLAILQCLNRDEKRRQEKPDFVWGHVGRPARIRPKTRSSDRTFPITAMTLANSMNRPLARLNRPNAVPFDSVGLARAVMAARMHCVQPCAQPTTNNVSNGGSCCAKAAASSAMVRRVINQKPWLKREQKSVMSPPCRRRGGRPWKIVQTVAIAYRACK